MTKSNLNKLELLIIQRLKEKRKSLGLTYEKLADLSELHRTSISLIERGKIKPTLYVCLKIAEAMNLKIENVISEARKSLNKNTNS